MTHIIGDRIRETTTTTGTGTYTLAGAVAGYRTMATLLTANGDTGIFVITDGQDFEIIFGTRVSATTLARTTIRSSTNGGAAVNWGAGTKDVFMDMDALSVVLDALGNNPVFFAPQGRLTLTSATPVMASSVSGTGTIFYTPYVGDRVPIYDGTKFVPTKFVEFSTTVSDTSKNPSAIGASKVNDWFVWNDAGVIRLCHGPDWTNDTTRSAGTVIALIGGTSFVYVNNVAITNACGVARGTYVGTTRSDASGFLNWVYGGSGSGGVAGLFNTWNMYNRVLASSLTLDTFTSGSVTALAQNLNGSANNRCSFVTGLAEDSFLAEVFATAINNGSTGYTCVGVGLDSTGTITGTSTATQAAIPTSITGALRTTALGAHFVQALQGAVTANGTIYGSGTNGAINTGLRFSGMF